MTIVRIVIPLEKECGYSPVYLKIPTRIREVKQQAPLVDANSIVESIVQVSKQKENFCQENRNQTNFWPHQGPIVVLVI